MVCLRDSVPQVFYRRLLNVLRVFTRLLLISAVLRFSSGLTSVRYLCAYCDQLVQSRCTFAGPSSRHLTRFRADLLTSLFILILRRRVSGVRGEQVVGRSSLLRSSLRGEVVIVICCLASSERYQVLYLRGRRSPFTLSSNSSARLHRRRRDVLMDARVEVIRR